LKFAAAGAKQEPKMFEGGGRQTLLTEINGLGGGTFPFATTLATTMTIKGADIEIKA
jgi:hypothetical protein